MKKMFIMALAIMLIFGLTLTGCSGSSQPASGDQQGASANAPEVNAPESQDTSWDDIKAKGYMVVGLDDGFPPMGFRDEKQEIVGFDIDFAKAAAEKLGIEVRFQPVEWSGVIMELDNKNIDLIWNGMTITEDRKAKANFTRPYLNNRQIIIVQTGSAVKSKADLAGKKVALQSGSSAVEALQSDAEVYNSLDEVVEFSTNPEALQDLAAGRVAAVVVDEVVGKYYIAKEPSKYQVLEEDFGKEEYGVAVRKTDKAFLEELQKAIDEVITEGTAAKISEKWFGEDIVVKP